MSIGNIDILYTQNLSGTSISAETIFLSGTNITTLFGGTGTSVSGNFLSLSGGTVTGNTNFSSNLSATTFISSTATTTYLKVNTASASTTNPERVFIYDGVVNGYSNVLVGMASASTYAQLNIKNISAASGASSDIVATANNGDENTNYVDLGINSSAFAGFVGTANDAYLYSAGNNLLIGNTTQNKNVGIFVGSSTATTADFSSGKTTFNKPIYSGNSEISTMFPYDVSKYRTIGTSTFERWYCSANINSTLNGATLTRNVLRFVPFVISNSTTVDRIGIEVVVSGSAASNARLGIYDVSGGTIPNNLIEDSGTVDISLAGVKSININRTLNAGLYYLVMVHNSAVAPQFRIIAAGQGNNILGSPSTLGTGIGNLITASYAYAVLPNNCSGLTLTVATTSAPAIYLRFSG